MPVQLAALIKRQNMARPTAESIARGGPPDVHLHTHIFFPRSGFEPETQKWLTVDEYALLEATKATEVAAIHDAEVHRGLVDLGFEMEYGDFDDDANGRRTWRIKGITTEAEAFFSTNHERLPQVVRAWEQETGRVASRAMQNKLMHDTKLPKDLATALQDVNPDWSRWADWRLPEPREPSFALDVFYESHYVLVAIFGA